MTELEKALQAANKFFNRKFDNAEHALHDINLEEERDPQTIWLNEIFELNEIATTTYDEDLIHGAKFKKLF